MSRFRFMRGLHVTGLVLVAAVAALMFASAQPTQKARAEPRAILVLNSGLCVTLGVAFGGVGGIDAANSCIGMYRQQDPGNPSNPSFQLYAKAVAGRTADPGLFRPDPEDLAVVDRDRNQVHEQQWLNVIAFVTEDSPVRFETSGAGTFIDGANFSMGAEYRCETDFIPVAGQGTGVGDPDCDGDGATEGDGVVVARLSIGQPSADELGDHTLIAIQDGIGYPTDFTIVGKAVEIVLTPLFGKSVISTGATPPTPSGENADPTDCNFSGSVGGVLGANNDPEKVVVIAQALDNEGNSVIGTLLNWDRGSNPLPATADDLATDLGPSAQGMVALPQTPTLDLGATIGIGFPQFVCGLDEPGVFDTTVRFDALVDNASAAPPGSLEKATLEIDVVGSPTSLALAAAPNPTACDGVATSAVSATVATGDGDPAANGTDVNFSVVTLGVANPLKADTGDGIAMSNVLPVSGTQRGVTVNTTVRGERDRDVLRGRTAAQLTEERKTNPQATYFVSGDFSYQTLAQAILVNCGGAAAGAPPPPGAPPSTGGSGSAGAGATPPTGTISPPDTGSGGPVAGVELAWWPALLLAGGAVALGGARLALARRLDR